MPAEKETLGSRAVFAAYCSQWQRPNSLKHGTSSSNLGDDNNLITIHADLVDAFTIVQQMPGLTPESRALGWKEL